MKTIKFKNWELIADEISTTLTYVNAEIGSADSCVCNECKNYATYRDNVFPQEVRQLFLELGIDYKKESEVTRLIKLKNGLHLYSGWFHYKGNFNGANCEIPMAQNGFTLDLTEITENFKIGFRISNTLSFFEDKSNLVQVEFETEIPWVIDNSLETD